MPEIIQISPDVAFLDDDMKQILEGCERPTETLSPGKVVLVPCLAQNGFHAEFTEVSK